MTPDQITTDDDGWGYRTGARFVDPPTWEKHAETVMGRRNIHIWPLVEGLILAADNQGQIIDYQPRKFYEGPLSDGMRNEDDAPDWRLAYDRFAASVLPMFLFQMVEMGLLATRGNGNSVDYRLALPGGEGA
ncbi:hypothetical protein [Micromonospora sonchi]|nr:hypothetical protein [Micromonospora sonchi]